MSKRKIILCSLLILLTILSFSGVYDFKTNKGTINNKNISKSNLAIIINSNGVESNINEVPKGNYTLNEEKTVCENGGKVKSYDSSTGKIGFSFLGSDRCTLYFDEIIDNEPPVISNLNVSGNLVTATLSDNENLLGYGLSTSNTIEPSSYTQISGKTYNLSLNVTSEGTYYLWVKDVNGNKTVSMGIDLRKYGYETILLNNSNGASTIEEAKTYIESKGNPDFTNTAKTNEGMYAMEDDLGTSYYFRGAIDNNWVKFGKDSSNNDMYWRIIRINGDGSIRMIYTGTTAPTEDTKVVMKSENTQIGKSVFNSSDDKSEYVGYMYTIGKQHGISIDSTIKKIIDNWYKTTTLETDVSTKKIVANEIFCNDRSASTSESGPFGEISSWESSPTNNIYYGAYGRVINTTIPKLTCPTTNDKFTVSSDNGNQALTYPVGLITIDELTIAGNNWKGIAASANTKYYLYTNQTYWTGSPYYIKNGGYSYIHLHDSYGFYTQGVTSYDKGGVRPVINLSANVKLSGDGTWNNVYTVS